MSKRTHDHDEELPDDYRDNPVYVDPERDVRISLRMLTVCAAALVTGTISIIGFGLKWSNKIDDLHRQFVEMQKLMRSSWTLADEREFSHRMQRDNPTLKMPDPTDVHRTIHEER